MKTRRNSDGFVLTGVLSLLVIASVVGGSFLFSARNSLRTAERWEDYDQCLWVIQSALEERKYDLYQDFREVYDATHSWDSLDVLENYNAQVTISITNLSGVVVAVSVATTSGSAIKDVATYEGEITIANVAQATYKGVTRKIQEEVLYQYKSTGNSGGDSVFDYSFFIDNAGYFSGVNCDFNGDVRANKNIELKYSSMMVNGDVYASGIVDSKKDYKHDSWSTYESDDVATARPGSNTDFDTSNPNTLWAQGYNEAPVYFEGVEPLEMPFVGPLVEYEDYAVASTGTISQGGVVMVDAVWGDDAGEDIPGVEGILDDGSLFLDGTVAPIEIDGIIVARGDIYIKGSYTGQGTLYAGRNIHIIADLGAVDPPSWPKPDSNPTATVNINKDKDFLGLCAKGSLVFGDYNDWVDAVDKQYLAPPYTASHVTDSTDAANGYVTSTVDGISYFDGDYTNQDGENHDAVQTDGSPRLYYEGVLGEADFAALGPEYRGWIGQMDAVLYSNHLLMGVFDPNSTINGAVVCRDEAIKRHGDLTINWDIRTGASSLDGAGFTSSLPGSLPRIASATQMVRWMELPVE